MSDVGRGPGGEVVEAHELVNLGQTTFAEVAAEESGPSGHHGSQ